MIKTTPFEMVFIIRDQYEAENNSDIALPAVDGAPNAAGPCGRNRPMAL